MLRSHWLVRNPERRLTKIKGWTNAPANWRKLRHIAADPHLRKYFYLGIGGKSHATIEDLIAILELTPGQHVNNGLRGLAADVIVDSSSTQDCNWTSPHDQTKFCSVVWSVINETVAPPTQRTVKFWAQTECLSGTDCSLSTDVFVAGSSTVTWTDFFGGHHHSGLLSFSHAVPIADTIYSLNLMGTGWSGVMNSTHLIYFGDVTRIDTIQLGSSGASGTI